MSLDLDPSYSPSRLKFNLTFAALALLTTCINFWVWDLLIELLSVSISIPSLTLISNTMPLLLDRLQSRKLLCCNPAGFFLSLCAHLVRRKAALPGHPKFSRRLIGSPRVSRLSARNGSLLWNTVCIIDSVRSWAVVEFPLLTAAIAKLRFHFGRKTCELRDRAKSMTLPDAIRLLEL